MRISPTAIAAAMGNRRKEVLKIIKLKAIFSAADNRDEFTHFRMKCRIDEQYPDQKNKQAPMTDQGDADHFCRHRTVN